MVAVVHAQCAIIGGGAVGLACGVMLARAGYSVIVLEADNQPGTGISSRNSEVIHASLYYPSGSLKSSLCLRGSELLYEFLESRGVPHLRCGKIVVGSDDYEMAALEKLRHSNDLKGVSLITSEHLRSLEPEVHGMGALWSENSGIFDSHSYIFALVSELETHGGLLVCRSPVERVIVGLEEFEIFVGGSEPFRLCARTLVNSAGLFATDVARRFQGFDTKFIPPFYLAKGSYFGLRMRSPFKRLVYPAPVDGGLGTHATIDMAGRTRFGPDVEWLPHGTSPGDVDYSVDFNRNASFTAAIRRYWPSLPDGVLYPDYSGCRPKLSQKGEPPADFLMQTSSIHRVPGLVNLFGIESPGLTASLAIGEIVVEALRESYEL